MAVTRVKICGITRSEDAALAAEFGADFLGLNFISGPRRIDRAMGQRIQYEVPTEEQPSPHLRFVALCAATKAEFPSAAEWDDVPRVLVRDFQVYGSDYARLSFPGSLGLQWWMVRHVTGRESITDIASEVDRLAVAPAGLLMDTASQKLGGTGKSFNWHWIAEAREAGELDGLPPIILAGGLTPENVAEAIRIARPYAVDVSSGVEVAGKPGVKDPVKVRDFIQAAKGV